MISKSRTIAKAAIGSCVLLASLATVNVHATVLKIEVENRSERGGLWFTPVFLGFHDGSFDAFDVGSQASAALELIAEDGVPSGLIGEVAAVAGGIGKVLFQDPTAGGPPGVLFAPGQSQSTEVHLDPTANRFFSFASMLLPSNDAFFGNDDPEAYTLFDALGDFVGDFEINIFGSNIYDAGTEENDGFGAPLSVLGFGHDGLPGTADDIPSTPTSPTSVIASHSGLDTPFLGTNLAVGSTLTSTFTDDTLLATIRVSQGAPKRVSDSTPYIGAMSFLALLGFQLVARKRVARVA